jgi:hypothetical protein
MAEKLRDLLITEKRSWLTQAICQACGKKFLSRLRDPETSEWEIKIQFERHKCDPIGLPIT